MYSFEGILTTYKVNFEYTYVKNFNYLRIVSESRNDASKSIVPFQEVVLDRQCYLLEDQTLRVNDLQNFQHIDVLVQNILSYYSRDQQSFIDLGD